MWNEDQETKTFDVERVLVLTDMAMFCRIEGGDYWIPFGECDPDSDLFDGRETYELKGASGKITIPRWLAKAKGII
jgi:hypothetical protein